MSAAPTQLKPPPLLRNPSFHLLWSSTFASGFGDRLAFFIAMALLGFAGEGKDDSSIIAGLDFFFFLPYLLWSPIAGWLTDRLPRRIVLLAADELRGVIVLSAFLLIPAGHTGIIPESEQWKVFTFMGVIGVMAATFVPAKLAVVPGVVGDAMLTRANSAVVTMGVIGNLIGFLIGGRLAEQSIRAAILLCAGCYVVSGLFWAFMRTRYERPRTAKPVTLVGIFREISDGMIYAVRHRPVLVLIAIAAMIWTATSIYMPALAALNKVVFEGSQQSYGYLAGGLGIGMILGAVAIAGLNARLGNEIIMIVGIVGCGVCIGSQMYLGVYWLSIALSVGTGFCASMLLVPLNTLIQRVTPNYIRGRVFAAKEIIVEFGKVVLSLLIWRVQGTDPIMRPAAMVLALAMLVMAVIGLYRYVLKGPAPGPVLNLCWRWARLCTNTIHRLKVVGKHRVPHTGPVIIVCNHTAGLDPALVQSAMPRMIRWMMAKEFQIFGLRWFWSRYDPIAVDRKASDAAAARAAVQTLRDGRILGVFPEGHINHERVGLLPFGPGIALITKRSDAPIVPVYISGTPSRVHPFVSYLKPSRSRVVFGEPFRLTAEQSADRQTAIHTIRQKLEALMKNCRSGLNP